jgi:lipoprotein-anchoring transpeptidase ErfK/SrfK
MKLKRGRIIVAAIPLLAALAVAAAARGTHEPAVSEADPSGLRIYVDLSARRLKMYEADTLVWQYPIAIGADGYPTPRGQYWIRKMVWNPKWVPPNSAWARKYTPKAPGHPANPMKVVKIFFKEPTYYIHGTGEGYSLGRAASHGCIRMDPEHVAEVARYIMEHGGQPRPESWFSRVLRFRSEERPIHLKNPVPLVITG